MKSNVYLIAGHNGPGTGAKGFIDEGSETIVFRNMVYSRLYDYGINAIRDCDITPLRQIVQWLRNTVTKRDICIDIHFNASSNKNANGSEVFLPKANTIDERVLGGKLASTISKTIGLKNRGVNTEDKSYHGKIAMLSGFDCCNILLELCFVTNENDTINYNKNKEELATEIALDILEFVRTYKW